MERFCPICGAANPPNRIVCIACNASLRVMNEALPTAPLAEDLLKGRYRLQNAIGKGGFATVYRAEDTQQYRTVAVKAITLKTLSAQEIIDATDSYNREIQFGIRLKHRALPIIYDHFMDREHWYLISEFVDGPTLDEYMQRLPEHRLPLEEVLNIGAQLCDVLAYLHALTPPVIFRDIKPDNIMLTASGRIKLVDFGIARHYRPGKSRDTQALGSPGYAAPEQYGSAQTTERSDIYSLGATLRTLLTGINPLDETDEARGGYVLAAIPPALNALLEQMRERAPEKRPANVEEVHRQLVLIAQDEGISLPAISPLYRKSQRRVAPSPSSPKTPPVRKSPPPTPPPTPARAPGATIGFIMSLTLACSLIIFGVVEAAFLFNYHNPRFDPKPNPQYLEFPGGEAISTLDPALATSTPEKQVASMLYVSLTKTDKHLRVQPYLATSWEQDTGDGLIWTFHLRDIARFGDGTPLTANDVVYSLDRALDPALASPSAPYSLSVIASATRRLNGQVASLIGIGLFAPDPHTVQIKTEKRVSFLPVALTCICASIVNKRVAEKHEINSFIYSTAVSGPFKVKLWTPNNYILLTANSEDTISQTHIQTVRFLSFGDDDAFSIYARKDDLSVVEVPAEKIAEAATYKSFLQVPQLAITYYAMNYRVRPFSNIKIRQAFALALDKANLTAYRQAIAMPTNHIIPEGMDGYNKNLVGPGGTTSAMGANGTLARKLLQEGMHEEGITGVDQFPTITFSYFAHQEDEVLEEEVHHAQKMWQDTLGITVRLQFRPYQDLHAIQKNSASGKQELQLWRLSWQADYPDPQNWTTMLFGKDSPYNLVHYGQNDSRAASAQQRVQQQLAQADALDDQSQRLASYQQAEQDLVNDVAWVPIYQTRTNYLINPMVQGYTINAMGLVPVDAWDTISLR